jgi:NADPH-dependent glutamate synthase beta subunit-like oxidoreductase
VLHIAVVGAGPAGYYTAEALVKTLPGSRVDIIDRLPTPFGLIRAGVAPDHQSIKAVAKRYEATADGEGVSFIGNLDIGNDVSADELLSHYHAVVLATGAPDDRPLGIPGDHLPGVHGSGAFVGWYNGHPDATDLDVSLASSGVAVVGNGNVAIDVARIIAKTASELGDSDIAAHAAAVLRAAQVRDIHIVGRRGPHQASFTPKEMGELGHLERAQPFVQDEDLPPLADDAALEPGLRKTVSHLRAFAAAPPAGKPVAIHFDFFARPVRVEGDGRVERLVIERTALVDGKAVGTGAFRSIDCGLIVSCIGYLTPSVPGVPHDDSTGRFASHDGRITPGLYAVGWAQHGPRGTIGTNRPDAFAIAEMIAVDAATLEGERTGRAGLDALIAARGVAVTSFADWRRIDAAEIARARPGAPREKFVRRAEMLAAGKP